MYMYTMKKRNLITFLALDAFMPVMSTAERAQVERAFAEGAAPTFTDADFQRWSDLLDARNAAIDAVIKQALSK